MSDECEPQEWSEIIPNGSDGGIFSINTWVEIGDFRVYDDTLYLSIDDGWISVKDYIDNAVEESIGDVNKSLITDYIDQ